MLVSLAFKLVDRKNSSSSSTYRGVESVLAVSWRQEQLPKCCSDRLEADLTGSSQTMSELRSVYIMVVIVTNDSNYLASPSSWVELFWLLVSSVAAKPLAVGQAARTSQARIPKLTMPTPPPPKMRVPTSTIVAIFRSSLV